MKTEMFNIERDVKFNTCKPVWIQTYNSNNKFIYDKGKH